LRYIDIKDIHKRLNSNMRIPIISEDRDSKTIVNIIEDYYT